MDDEGGDQGTLTVAVVSDTQSTVMDSWNLVQDVHLILEDMNWCYARVYRGDQRTSRHVPCLRWGQGRRGL